jgi:energy-coupling factor transporter ATP-binding protein EcfA2
MISAEIPDMTEPWAIGLITGPSGSGKTSLAREAFGDSMMSPAPWPENHAIVEGVGEGSIQHIVGALSAVGFSSPPDWLKPYRALSNGQKFRADLARALLAGGEVVVFDEFTSVVDRTVARVAACAAAKAIRSGQFCKRFVAVSCHDDIREWLEPDWVLDMSDARLVRGRLRRPPISLTVRPVVRDAWSMFKRHHYLNAGLAPAVRCFGGFIEDRLAAFTAVISQTVNRRTEWREHRTVCLPDFQGVGIGNALSEFVAGIFIATGRKFRSSTAHPAMIRHRMRSARWKLVRPPGHARPYSARFRHGKRAGSSARLTASFLYVGPCHPEPARCLGLIR